MNELRQKQCDDKMVSDSPLYYSVVVVVVVVVGVGVVVVVVVVVRVTAGHNFEWRDTYSACSDACQLSL